MIIIKEENILNAEETIIVQQVNCIGKMGAGLAKSIMQKYDNVRPSYFEFHKKMMNSGLTSNDLLGMVQYIKTHDKKIIANIFGQEFIRKNRDDKETYTKKYSLLCGIEKVKEKAEKYNLNIAIPYKIGCGLAQGNWEEIYSEIEKIFKNSKVNVTIYKLEKRS